ncbi:hypothetical protein G6F58_012875 [Rhizopus delemar]|nr:hypothetical protein G6F58_012875 [Rhizopus delemar]
MERQRTRDVHALALPAGQFVRIAAGEALRLQPHAPQQSARHRNGIVPGRAVHQRAEGDRIFDGHARVQRRIAVLEHHLRLAAEFAQRQCPRADRHAVKHQFAAILGDQLHHEPCGGGLAAARLPHPAQGLAVLHVAVNAVHRTHGVAAPLARQRVPLQRKVLDQPPHAQQRLGRPAHIAVGGAYRFDQCAHSLTSMADRSPSDSRLNDMDVMKIITPGNAATHGCV